MGRRTDKILIRQRHRFKNGLLIVGLCTAVGIGYPIIYREWSDLYALLNGGLVGLLGGIGMAVHQDFTLYHRIRRYHFFRRLVLVSVVYTIGFAILIIFVMGLTGSLESNESFVQHINSPVFQDFLFKGDYVVILLYALALSSLLSFTFIMRRKVDGNVLWNMISGKYAIPREEERITMFLDMNDSTRIAEELGEMLYFEFVNEFFADITPAILRTGGKIYRYVGDEIVVTWPMSKNANHKRSIITYFLAMNELHGQREKYLTNYRNVPSFKAAFHCGKVVAGEIGDVKSQLVLHGDMMYNTALIEKQCNKLGKSLLVSSVLMERLTMPKFYKVKRCGELSGLLNEVIDLYTITEHKEFEPA